MILNIYNKVKFVASYSREPIIVLNTSPKPLLKMGQVLFCLERGGGRRMWIRKFLNVNIIDLEKVVKPKGGGGQCG